MDFRILGPLEVENEGRLVPVGRRKQRAVLAVLLLHANHVVSTTALIDAIWGEHAPETALTTLQGYVSALRKTFGAEVIRTQAPGYVLETAAESIDLGRFQALVRAGTEALRAEDATTASDRLTAALSLWRGEPLEDLDSVPLLETERRRLEEVRLAALEERIEADLSLGRHADVVPELQSLVREEPLRERLRGQLMLALYRSGRQAEALEVYREGRHLLAEELGLEPGEPLRRLEHGILDHDPALGPVAPPRSRPVEVRDRSGRRWLLALVGASVVIVAAAAVGVVLTRGNARAVAVVPNSVAVIDTRTNRVLDDVLVKGVPVAVASGEGGTWACLRGGTVAHIDAATRKLLREIHVGRDCTDVAVGFGSVWVAGGADRTLVRIDPKQDRAQTVALPRRGTDSTYPLVWVAAGAGSVWATRGAQLLQIDPADNRLIQAIDIHPGPVGVAAGRSYVWVVIEPSDNRLLRFDAIGRRYPAIQLPASSVEPAASYGAATSSDIWLLVYQGLGEIRRYSFGRLAARAAMDRYPLDVAVGAGAVWVVDAEGSVLRLDPALTTVERRIPTAATAQSSLAVGYGAVWVAIQG